MYDYSVLFFFLTRVVEYIRTVILHSAASQKFSFSKENVSLVGKIARDKRNVPWWSAEELEEGRSEGAKAWGVKATRELLEETKKGDARVDPRPP